MRTFFPDSKPLTVSNLAGWTLLVTLVVLFAGTGKGLSPGMPFDARFMGEIEHPVFSSHIEKLRIEKSGASSDSEPDDDRSQVQWLIQGWSAPVAATSARYSIPDSCGTYSCRDFRRPPPTAPPLA